MMVTQRNVSGDQGHSVQNKKKRATVKSSAKQIGGGSVPQREEIVSGSLSATPVRTQRELGRGKRGKMLRSPDVLMVLSTGGT